MFANYTTFQRFYLSLGLIHDSFFLSMPCSLPYFGVGSLKRDGYYLFSSIYAKTNLFFHQDGRTLTPSPCRSSRALSSPISPPSSSSLTSSPPPVYADGENDGNFICLCTFLNFIQKKNNNSVLCNNNIDGNQLQIERF